MGSNKRKVWRKLWRRAVFAAFVLRLVPFVRMVGLNGSMMTGNCKEGSDIDFHIVTKKGHIYTAKFLTAALLSLFGLKRNTHHVAYRVCLNRFAIDDFLQITPHDYYHAHVFSNLFPLYSADGLYHAYVQANSWMKDFGFTPSLHKALFTNTRLVRFIQLIGEKIWGWQVIESAFMKFQHQRVKSDVRLGTGNNVIILSERELRFHLDKNYHG